MAKKVKKAAKRVRKKPTKAKASASTRGDDVKGYALGRIEPRFPRLSG